MMPENVDTSGLIHEGVARTLTYPSGIVKATLFENKKENVFFSQIQQVASCVLFHAMFHYFFCFMNQSNHDELAREALTLSSC